MKKPIAILLTVILALSIAACGGGGAQQPAAPAGTSPAPGGTSPAPGGTSPASGGSGDQSQPGSDAVNPSDILNAIGYFTDGVDPHSRDTYNIAWMYMRPMALFLSVTSALKELEPIYNFTTWEYNANSDIDAIIQTIELYADQGVDGYMIVIDATAQHRIKEVLDSTGLPYIGILNSVRDDAGRNLVPLVGMEGVTVGREMTGWMFDNYKDYWGDIDTSKMGMLNFTFSPNRDFHERHDGNIMEWNARLPGNTNIFQADGVTGGLTEETGYELASAILAAHPEVEYWFIPACLELYAQGATRATEHLGMTDRVLIVAVNSDVLVAAWEGGYDGNFIACVATTPYQYAVPALSALVSLMNGTSTFDTLWSALRAPDDVVTYFEMAYEIVTIDTWQAYFDFVRSESGL